MSMTYLNYLQREHARLEGELARESGQRCPDQLTIARLEKLKLAVGDQIAACQAWVGTSEAA
jgi:hypothetical protein